MSTIGPASLYNFTLGNGLIINYRMNDEYLCNESPKADIKILISLKQVYDTLFYGSTPSIFSPEHLDL